MSYKQAQGVLDDMSDAQVCATKQALEARFPLDPAETCNGVGIGEWHELVYAEWDRRGGTWKVWEGNPGKVCGGLCEPMCAQCNHLADDAAYDRYL